jgi:DNA-directed RNA polymerase subunit RPC12/RpoP
VALGEVETANRSEFEIRCDPCGFDVLPVPFADLAARQFPGVEGELVALTTRCPACGGGMLIKRRGSDEA